MLLKEVKKGPQDYKIYVDLDGVLADFVKGVAKLLDGGYSEKRYESDSKYRSKMWKAVKEYSKKGGKLWLELEPMSDAKKLWDYVKNYDPEILSATGNPEYGAGEQKHKWVAKHVDPKVKVNLTRTSAEKANHAKENYILIDDKSKSINPWKAAGGIGILHKNAANTIAQLKKLGL